MSGLPAGDPARHAAPRRRAGQRPRRAAALAHSVLAGGAEAPRPGLTPVRRLARLQEGELFGTRLGPSGAALPDPPSVPGLGASDAEASGEPLHPAADLVLILLGRVRPARVQPLVPGDESRVIGLEPLHEPLARPRSQVEDDGRHMGRSRFGYRPDG